MTLELRLRRFPFLPDLLQTGNREPRKAHFLGKKQADPVEKQDQSQGNDNTPQRQKTGKYRPLSDIALGEVAEALRHFMPQMVPAPVEGWVARNYFCELAVNQEIRDQSPIFFGRVNTCYPSDGNVQNVEQMEMFFPGGNPRPDLLNIHRTDILWQRPVQTYCVGIKMYLSEMELEDFRRSENIFIEKGFAPIYETGAIDLIDINEQNQSSLLWLNVVGSEWFASIPDSIQPEIRERLHALADWGNILLNYHPKRYALRYLSINEELDFNYGFTKHYLLTPQDTNQVLQMVDEKFSQIFMRA